MTDYTISSDAINEEFEKIKSFLENKSIDGERLIDLYIEAHSRGEYCFNSAVRYDMPTASNVAEFRNKLDNLSSEDILVNECTFESEELKQRFFDTKGMFVWFNHFVFDKLKSFSIKLYSENLIEEKEKALQEYKNFETLIANVSFICKHFWDNKQIVLGKQQEKIDLFYEYCICDSWMKKYSVPQIYAELKIWEREKSVTIFQKILDKINMFIYVYLYIIPINDYDVKDQCIPLYGPNPFFKFKKLISTFTSKILFADNVFKTSNDLSWKKLAFSQILFDRENPLLTYSPYMYKNIAYTFPNTDSKSLILFMLAYSAVSYGKDMFKILQIVMKILGDMQIDERKLYGFDYELYNKAKRQFKETKLLYCEFLIKNSLYSSKNYAEKLYFTEEEEKIMAKEIRELNLKCVNLEEILNNEQSKYGQLLKDYEKKEKELQAELKNNTNNREKIKDLNGKIQAINAEKQELILCWKKQKECTIEFLKILIEENPSIDSDSINNKKQEFINLMANHCGYKDLEIDITCLEDITYKICQIIQDKIQREKDFKNYRDKIQGYFSQNIQNQDLLLSLISAEWLYDKYVKNQNNNEKRDYCFISLLYYKTIETFLNELIYKPYKNDILSEELKKLKNLELKLLEKANSKKLQPKELQKLKDDLKIEQKKIEKNIENIFKKNYLTNTPSKYYRYEKNDTKNGDIYTIEFKESCELGPLLFLCAYMPPELKKYLENDKYPEIDCDKLKELCEIIKKPITEARNESAHGGKIITLAEAKEAKKRTYRSCDSCNYNSNCKYEAFECILHHLCNILNIRKTKNKQ